MRSQGCHTCLTIKQRPCRMLRVLFRNHFVLILPPKETAATNPKRFAAGSVPLHHSLGCCTNICAGAWERQGRSGNDTRGTRQAGGFLALAGLVMSSSHGLGCSGASWPAQAQLQSASGRAGGGSGSCPAPTGRGQVKLRVAPVTSPCDHALQFQH